MAVQDHLTEQVTVTASKVAMYGGSGTAFIFGLTANELAALGGLLVAIIGLIVTTWFQWRRDKREAEAIRDLERN